MKSSKKLRQLFNSKYYTILHQYTKDFKKPITFLVLSNILVSLISVSIAYSTKQMIDLAITSSISKASFYIVIFACLLILQNINTSFQMYHFSKTSERLKKNLQYKLLSELYDKQWIELSQYRSGDLVSRVYDDTNNIVTSITSTLPTLISVFFQFIFAFSLLFMYDQLLATLTFLVSPITIVFSMVIGRKLKKVQMKIRTVDANQKSFVNESLHNTIILKTFNRLKHNLSIVSKYQNEKVNLVKEKSIISIKANIMMSIGYQFAFFAALTLGAYRLSVEAISFGTFTAFLQLVGQVQAPIQIMSRNIPQMISSFSSIDRIEEMKKLNTDCSLDNDAEKIKPEKIVFQNVSFDYSPNQDLLKNISLEIAVGEKVAIMGPSGVGKTTLIHLMLDLISPLNGNIHFIEDNKLFNVNSSTRQYFAYVPQTSSLFSGTIRENLFIKPEVTNIEIDLALKTACVHEFSSKLDDSLDSLLTEQGGGLSQGQLQRITIARALLHGSPFIIFDEATSALDMDLELRLIENIKCNYPDRSLIAITHRTSILDICDRIYHLDNGELIS